jgi:nicotinamidase-related amidase
VVAAGPAAVDGRGLLDVDDSLVVVIDVQARFLEKLPAADSGSLVARIRWLVQASAWLGVPVVVTAEDVGRLGGVVDAVASVLPIGTPVHDKMVFGLASSPEIMAAVERAGRRTAILVGLETDVCVGHSAIGLLQEGYRVAVLSDCTGSPGPAHEAGLRRAEHAGAIVLPLRTLVYEWVRGVARAGEFRAAVTDAFGVPDGVIL